MAWPNSDFQLKYCRLGLAARAAFSTAIVAGSTAGR
jgi:hypothetical protein